MPLRIRCGWRWPLLLYVVLLHASLALLLVKTDALLLIGKTLGWLPPEEWSEAYFHDMLAQAARGRLAVPNGTLLLGDSLIAEIEAGQVAPDAENFGLGGETLRTLRARMPTLPAAFTARRLLIGAGVNDLKYRDPLEITADASALLNDLPSSIGIVLLSPLPVDESVKTVRQRWYLRNVRIRAITEGLRGICAARPSCVFVDAWPVMTDGGTGLAPRWHGPDGWHLSAAGRAALAAVLAVALVQPGTVR